MKIKSLILTPAILFLFASTASAFTPSQFIGIDRNADSQVSKEEARDYRTRYFSTLDENGNGTVEFEEYVKAKNLRSATANPNAEVKVTDEYKEADANSDTILTIEEFLAAGTMRFDLLDTDKNGYISQAEFVAPGL